MQLICPKCQGAMRQYERNGVHIDQCSDCRGIFLDRGELERLTDAETSWHRPEVPQPSQPQPSYQQSSHQQSSHHQGSHQQGSHHQSHGKPHKRKSFLEDLFD